MKMPPAYSSSQKTAEPARRPVDGEAHPPDPMEGDLLARAGAWNVERRRVRIGLEARAQRRAPARGGSTRPRGSRVAAPRGPARTDARRRGGRGRRGRRRRASRARARRRGARRTARPRGGASRPGPGASEAGVAIGSTIMHENGRAGEPARPRGCREAVGLLQAVIAQPLRRRCPRSSAARR